MAKEEGKLVERVPVQRNLLIHTINYLVGRPLIEVEEYVAALRQELFQYDKQKETVENAKSSDSSGDSVPD